MADTLKKQLIDKIETALNTLVSASALAVVYSGKAHQSASKNTGWVVRVAMQWAEPKESLNFYECRLHVVINAFYKGATSVTEAQIRTAVDALEQALDGKMFADRGWGGLAVRTGFYGDQFSTDKMMSNTAEIMRSYFVEYHYRADNPLSAF